jgi:histone acetyltransferase
VLIYSKKTRKWRELKISQRPHQRHDTMRQRTKLDSIATMENSSTTDNDTRQDDSRKRKADDIDVNDSEEKDGENAVKDALQVKNSEDTADNDDNDDNNGEEDAVEDDGDDDDDDASYHQEDSDPTENGTEKEDSEQANKQTGSETATNTTAGTSDISNNNSSHRNPYETMRWIVVRNDGTPESMIKLVGLKSLFAKQLPKMPRAYIARLVFDRRHTSVAILSDNPAVKDSDEEIIGGICYRAFSDMRFGEIAFCAVNATHQVKGYGTKLMNLLKKTGAETGIEYFITYADNYAIGYFKKQGFTKSISMPKGRYFGLIKDYDGGTPMECYVHPSIDFLRLPEMLQAQRDFILERVKLNMNSHTVYDPLSKDFKVNLDGVSRASHATARAMAIPGILEAGWNMADLLASTGQGKEADRQKSALKSELLAMIRKIEEQQFVWPFREPVDVTEVPDYSDVIKEPIDLSTIEKRIRQDNHYKSKQMLFADLMLMVNNCKLYNEEVSLYVQCAVNLERFLSSMFHDIKT